MKASYLILIFTLLASGAFYVGNHSEMKTWHELFTLQNFSGLMGVLASVAGAYLAKSPINGNAGVLSTITSNGYTKVPKVKPPADPPADPED